MEQEINIHNGSNQINPAATVVQNNYIVQQGQQFPLPNLALGNPDTDNKVLPSCSDEVILLRRNFSFDEINRKILESEEVIIFGLGCTITTKLMYDKYISQELLPPSMKILFMDFKGDAVKVAAKREGEPVSKLKTRYKDNWLLV